MECGRRPARAATGETFQVSATIFRDGHERTRRRRGAARPGRQAGAAGVHARARAGHRPLRGADVTVTSEGAWRFQVEAWGDPIAQLAPRRGHQDTRGQDVELMLTEGALLFERAARRIPQPPGARRPAAARTALRALAATLRDRGLTPWDRLAAAEDPEIVAILRRWPLRDLVTRSRPLAADRGPGTGAVRLLVRVLPALRRGPDRPNGPPRTRLGHAAHRGQAAGRDRGHGLRRGLPAAGAPDRDDVPQGPRTTR